MRKVEFFLLFLLFFTLIGCNKADPNAYKSDPILADYQSQLQTTQSDIETLKKQMEETEKDLKQSPPQSGQASIHRKKLYELKERVSKLDQQTLYWKIRIESRAQEAQLEYLKSHKEGKPWPDKAALDSYQAQKRLRLNKLQWNQKDRIQQIKDSEKKGPSQPDH